MIEGSGSIRYLWLVDPDPDPGGPKTRGSRSGSATLKESLGTGRTVLVLIHSGSGADLWIHSWYRSLALALLQLVMNEQRFCYQKGLFWIRIPKFWILTAQKVRIRPAPGSTTSAWLKFFEPATRAWQSLHLYFFLYFLLLLCTSSSYV
jgi:hypothetical protein